MLINNSVIRFSECYNSFTEKEFDLNFKLIYISKNQNMLESENDLKTTLRGEAKLHCMQHCRYSQHSTTLLPPDLSKYPWHNIWRQCLLYTCKTVTDSVQSSPYENEYTSLHLQNYVTSLHCTLLTFRKACIFLLVIRFPGALIWKSITNTDQCSLMKWGVVLPAKWHFLTGRPDVHSNCLQGCKE